MAELAAELDAAERELMAHGGMETADYLQYVAEGSGNVAENGMFSIQVLSRALEVFGLQAVPLSSPDSAVARADPTSQQAFICNLQEHWFTVRQIHDQWWNLNSIFSAPEPLSAFYLSAFLGTLQEQGYTIFVVLGDLPPGQPPDSEADRVIPGVAGRWFTPEEARAATQEREQLKQQGFAQAAARGVLGKASAQGTWLTLRRPGAKRAHDAADDGSGDEGSQGRQGDDPDLARALAASMADAGGAGGSGSRPLGRGFAAAAVGAAAADDEDADLAAAIAASLAGPSAPSSGGGGGSHVVAAAAAAAETQPQAQQQQHEEERQEQQEQQRQGAGQASPGYLSADDEDAELAAAIAASLQPPAAEQQPTGAVGRPHQQEPQQQQSQQPAQQQQQQQAVADEAPPAAAAAAAAAAAVPGIELPELQPEPETGAEGAIEVALRLPGGGRASRRFHSATDTVGHLAAFAAQQGADVVAATSAGCQLAAQFPRRVFGDWGQSLAAAGVGHKEMITLELKPGD